MKINMHKGRLLLNSGEDSIGYVAILLGLYFLLLPFDTMRIGNLGSLLKLISLFPVMAIFLNYRKCVFKLNGLFWILVIALLFYFLSLFYTISFYESADVFKRMLLNTMLLLVAGGGYRYNRREFLFLKKALITSSVLTFLMAFFFADFSTDGRLTLRIGSQVEDPNNLNGYLFFALAYIVERIVSTRKPRYLAGLLLLLMFSLMTGSRGAMLGFLFVGGFTCLYTLKNKKSHTFRIILAILLILLFFLLFYDSILNLLPEKVAERFSLSFIAKHGSTNRFNIWSSLLDLYWDSPVGRQLMGYGMGTVSEINPVKYHSLGYVAHNLWLEYLMSGGFFGLLILLTQQILFGAEAFRHKDVVIIASFLGFLVMSMTLSLVTYKPMWNCMLMIMIMRNSQLSRAGSSLSDPNT